MGSDSDLEVMREAEKRLDYFGIAYETRIMSAHRTPDKAADYAANAQQRGLEVIIAGAGAAAHLAGAIVANTTLPVIGVPDRKSTRLNSSHGYISYAVFCLKKKNTQQIPNQHYVPTNAYTPIYIPTPLTSLRSSETAFTYTPSTAPPEPSSRTTTRNRPRPA